MALNIVDWDAITGRNATKRADQDELNNGLVDEMFGFNGWRAIM